MAQPPRTRQPLLAMIIAVMLAACGGGGGGTHAGSDSTATPGTAAAPGASAAPGAAAAPGTPAAPGTTAAPAGSGTSPAGNGLNGQAGETRPIQSGSYWHMDSFTYVNGGYSEQKTFQGARGPMTVVVVSTATLSGGTDRNNGSYQGSSLTFSISGDSAGTYDVVPSREALINAAAQKRPAIFVECTVGTGTTTGATSYAAESGQIMISRDEAGKLHLSSNGALPAVKQQDVLGGVAGAPARMRLHIHNAF